MPYAITPRDIADAAERIASYAHRTPVMTCSALDALAGRRLFFKCEQFQKVGAFKFRGACNAIVGLDATRAARGVVTHSSGNHAQAVALAAKLRGIRATIVMPRSAPPVKRAAVEGYGARVLTCEPTLEARHAAAAAVVEETGGVLVHPYDDPAVMAGQGTAALELMDAVDGLDAIVTPVGGGGLLSGTIVACAGVTAERRPRVFAGEPTGADDAARSLAAGERILQTAPNTVADGLLTSLGENTWPVIRDGVEDIVTVDDAAILAAMHLLWQRAKLLVEPSAAVALAAVLDARFRALEGIERVGIVLSGGNVAPTFEPPR